MKLCVRIIKKSSQQHTEEKNTFLKLENLTVSLDLNVTKSSQCTEKKILKIKKKAALLEGL